MKIILIETDAIYMQMIGLLDSNNSTVKLCFYAINENITISSPSESHKNNGYILRDGIKSAGSRWGIFR